LQLTPIHALVVVSYYLASYGFDEEDLFGVICCLLALIAGEFDPTLEVQISPTALLDMDQGTSCTHENLSSAALAQRLQELSSGEWTEKVNIGWETLRQVLLATEKVDIGEDYGYKVSCFTFDHEPDLIPYYNINGHIWAAAQTELLNYRRRQKSDPWMSENFDMKSVLQGLMEDRIPFMPLLDGSMMKPYCPCGVFSDTWSFCRREHASAYYFSNLDDWERSSFIDDYDRERR
jgi:hypothetical protein